MKHIRVFALLLSILMALSPLGGLAFADETEGESGQTGTTVAPAETTVAPAETTVAPAETTVAPAETTVAPAETTVAPAETTVAPAETTVTPAETTVAPTETATKRPENTNVPQSKYPRIVFNADGVIVDYSRLRQGGYLMVALPIGYEAEEGSVYWSNKQVGSGWKPDSDAHPSYFSQDIAQYLNSAKWEVKSTGFDLSTVFDMSDGSSRNIIAHAPKNNNWGMAEGTPFNAGYAVFYLNVLDNAPSGFYRLVFEYDMPDGVANSREKLEYVFSFVLYESSTATPSTTPTQTYSPTATVRPTGTQQPSDDSGDESPDDGGYATNGVVMIGECEVQTVKVKQTGVKLSIPISYVIDSSRIYSNHSDDGTVVQPGQGSDAYSQDILDYIEWLEVSVSPETAASESFPFQLSEQGIGKTVIANGTNYGYAVFDNLTVKRSLSNGSMAVPLTVRWIEAGADEMSTTEISTLVNVTGASSGGGGGGSYSTPTTPPQARVLVESLKTEPENVKAGDTFELVMTLKNTSADQYVQNMRLTITSEEDTLIPLSGSNTLYIDRIEKDSAYELRYPVRANMQVPDHPIKVDVALEYEDPSIVAQTASQSLVVNVEENRRVKVDDPVLDNAAPMAGDSVTASLQVINEGRTILYNVTVTAQCDNEDVILPVSSYLGNMEGGTSKKAELDLIPTMAGNYDITLQISYEDAMGEQFTESRSFSFYTMEEESYDSYYPMEDEFGDLEGDDGDGELTAGTVMQLLPLWIYLLGGGILVAVIMLMGLSARNRHRKALEDDEMD